MIATTLEMQNEAIRRIKTLIKKLNLNANILEYFKDGKKYYSYLTGGGFLGSVDTTFGIRFIILNTTYELTFIDKFPLLS